MERALPGPDEAHAILAARHQHTAELQRRRHSPGLLLELLIVAEPPGHKLELLAVRRDQGGAAIGAVVFALGVYDHRQSGGARGADHLLDVAQPALTVIRDNDHVMAGELLEILIEERHARVLADGRLEVYAHELLVARDHAQLDRGIEQLVALQGVSYAGLVQQPRQAVRLLVVAADGEQRAARAQGADVARHVRRAAQALVHPGHRHHRHRRLGGDALHLAVPVAVEHGVADHEHPGLGDFIQQFRQQFPCASVETRRSS